MNQSVKLGLRLQSIANMVPCHYDHIWDCCCDHGLLGMHLLENNLAGKVHFVDVVESLVQKVTQNLNNDPNLYPADRWQTFCQDVAKLPVDKVSQSKTSTHLIIIAGVGGDLLVELVEAIYSSNPESHIEFLLCPVRHHHHVRKNLIRLGMKLIDESIVEENNRFYEIIHVAGHGDKELTATGSDMWNFNDKSHCLYLAKTIDHFQRRLQGNCRKSARILTQYQSLREHQELPVSGI